MGDGEKASLRLQFNPKVRSGSGNLNRGISGIAA